jgi:hypothetical protein
MEPEKKMPPQMAAMNSDEVQEYQRLLSSRYTSQDFDPKAEERIKELQQKLFGEANKDTPHGVPISSEDYEELKSRARSEKAPASSIGQQDSTTQKN